MSRRWGPVLCLLALMLLVSCSLNTGASVSSRSVLSPFSISPSATNLCNKLLEGEGKIINIGRYSIGKGLKLLMNGTLGKAVQEGRFVAHVDQQTTKIYDKRKSQCRTASLTDLQTGQHISIQSTSIVLQSYPAQITATEIVILP